MCEVYVTCDISHIFTFHTSSVYFSYSFRHSRPGTDVGEAVWKRWTLNAGRMTLIDRISLSELRAMAESLYGDMVKGVVDLRQGLLVLDAELHADQEVFLLEQGSKQEDLWGINLYPDNFGTDDFLEFDSMINIRPSLGNRSRYVEIPEIRDAIVRLVASKVKPS